MSELLEAWIPLTLALNAVNRSMGVDDLFTRSCSAPPSSAS